VAKVISQRTVESAKPPKQGRTTKADGLVPGLQFIVHAGGKKSFRLLARIHGKQVNLEIGDAAIVSLADARAKAKGLLGAIAHGEDPREAKRAAVKTAAKTVEVVAADFIKRHAKVHNKPRTWAETERLIAGNVTKAWGKRPITSVDQHDVVALLDAVTDRGSPIAANRVLAAGRKMFNWAIERGMLKTSPFDRVKAPTPETSRDRVLNDSELALVLQAADTLGPVFGAFVKILTLTGQRREEVAGMMWAELDLDLTMWTIPRERTKNGIVHQVPIVPWVRSILIGLPSIAGSDFVLTTTGKTSISGYSKAKAALDAGIIELNGGQPIPPWRMHDLRRSMASTMARHGVNMPVVEKLLNHTSGSFAGVAGVYQRHDFADEKRQAMEAWAQHLLALGTGPVLALRA
jgi:integrase